VELKYKLELKDKTKSFIDKFINQYNIDKLEFIEFKYSNNWGNSGRCNYPISTQKVNKFKKFGKKLKRKKLFDIICRIGKYTEYPYTERMYIGCKESNTFNENSVIPRKHQLEWIWDEEEYKDINEMVIWIFGHEIFHYLRKTRQVEGQNTQSQANKFGFKLLREFKNKKEKTMALNTFTVNENKIEKAQQKTNTSIEKSSIEKEEEKVEEKEKVEEEKEEIKE